LLSKIPTICTKSLFELLAVLAKFRLFKILDELLNELSSELTPILDQLLSLPAAKL
jgi:hypothetical protein